jgi:hypothetical protein
LEDITAPGGQLHDRFLGLGDLTGKTADEITAAVGRPSSISSLGYGQTVLQWQATGCHTSLVFDENQQFVEISHQYAEYAEFSVDTYAPPEESNHSVAIIVGLIAGIALLVNMFL